MDFLAASISFLFALTSTVLSPFCKVANKWRPPAIRHLPDQACLVGTNFAMHAWPSWSRYCLIISVYTNLFNQLLKLLLFLCLFCQSFLNTWNRIMKLSLIMTIRLIQLTLRWSSLSKSLNSSASNRSCLSTPLILSSRCFDTSSLRVWFIISGKLVGMHG